MPDKKVKANATLGFKVGSQEALNSMLDLGSSAGAVHGTFYLTEDTHRLYIGNEDTSLSAVNEGIVTVQTLSDLPHINEVDYSQNAHLVGQFYYITGENILAVCNGKGWIQINRVIDSNQISSFEITIETDNNSDNVVMSTVTESTGSGGSITKADGFKLISGAGTAITYGTTSITVDGAPYTVPTITIAADYSIGVADDALHQGSNNGKVDVTLSSDSGGSANNTSFSIVGTGATDVSVNSSTGQVEINSVDSYLSDVTITATPTGFDFTVADSENHSDTASLTPHITYGNSPITVDFVNGTATLNAYTKAEIDTLMKNLNSMKYIGTYSTTNGTAATDITYSAGTTTVKKNNNGTEEIVRLHCGDSIISDALSWTYKGINVIPGSLLIANGTEGSDGYITAETLYFDVVRGDYNTDTTYHLGADSSQTGFALIDSNSNEISTVTVTGGADSTGTATTDKIKVTKSYDVTTGNPTLTIQHKDLSRSDTALTGNNGWTANVPNS